VHKLYLPLMVSREMPETMEPQTLFVNFFLLSRWPRDSQNGNSNSIIVQSG
jgi:hypothetical protein